MQLSCVLERKNYSIHSVHYVYNIFFLKLGCIWTSRIVESIHVHLGVPCRPGTGTPGHGTVPPCPGTARRDLVPCRASTPCRLSCPGTARLSLDGPCRAWGTVSPAVPCRARAQDTQELNQLQIMQYKQISYVQTQAFNNS